MDALNSTCAGGERVRTRGCPAIPPHFRAAGASLSRAIHATELGTARRAAAAAPEWVELLPAGEFRGRDGRGPFRLEDPAAVIAATRALGMDAPIDYDHATDFAAPEGRPAPAAGWIRDFAIRDGAIWARVEWTARAAAAIASREYRYLSPVFQFDPKTGTVSRILRAGLTNNPNLYLTAISAAKAPCADDEVLPMDEFLSRLKELLGLDASADADAVEAAVRDLVAAASDSAAAQSADPARYVAVAEHHKALTELNTLRAERARERAERAVDDAIRNGKLTPAQREWATAYCAADARGFESFVARQPALLARGTDPSFEGRAPTRGGTEALGAAERAICAQLGVSHGDYLKRRNGRPDFLKLETSETER